MSGIIGKKIGIPPDQLQPFFETLTKSGKLEKKKDKYYAKEGK